MAFLMYFWIDCHTIDIVINKLGHVRFQIIAINVWHGRLLADGFNLAICGVFEARKRKIWQNAGSTWKWEILRVKTLLWEWVWLYQKLRLECFDWIMASGYLAKFEFNRYTAQRYKETYSKTIWLVATYRMSLFMWYHCFWNADYEVLLCSFGIISCDLLVNDHQMSTCWTSLFF